MNIILYNPLSKSGSNDKRLKKVTKILIKRKEEFKTIDITKIKSVTKFLHDEKDSKRFIILGGDGTLNVIANHIHRYDIKQEIFLFKSGTGNDFARSIKKEKGLMDIKKYLYNLPTVKFNNESHYFLNGAGLGLDGLIAHKVNTSRHKNNKFNYFRHALEAFSEFKAKEVTLEVDGVKKEFEKTWLISVMNDKYLGGGMKIAPRANRNNKSLEVVIVKRASKFVLFLLFPSIYLGLHRFFKRYVEIITANEVKLNFKEPMLLQIDGEVYEDVYEAKMNYNEVR